MDAVMVGLYAWLQHLVKQGDKWPPIHPKLVCASLAYNDRTATEYGVQALCLMFASHYDAWPPTITPSVFAADMADNIQARKRLFAKYAEIILSSDSNNT